MTTVVSDVEQPRPATDQPDEPGFEELARRVDDAVAALNNLDTPARVIADELKSAIEAVHRAGLVTIVRRMRADEAARHVLFDLVDDPVVHLLLSLHNIVRPDPMTQALKALDAVRPQLQGHGGDVELVRLDEGTAFVRLKGACNGCSMSSVTLRNLVEQALVETVPSITGVEVVPNEPEQALISVDSLFTNRFSAEEGWASAGRAEDIPVGDLKAIELITRDSGRQVSVLVINLDQRLTAYVNECAHEALPLDNAVIDASNGTLTCPWHGFCYDATSGECLTAPAAQLEQLPLRVDNGQVWIQVGA